MATSPAATAPANRANPVNPAADPLLPQVKALLESIRHRAAAQPADDEEWKAIGPEVDRLLGMADAEVAGGRAYTALERMADANRYLGGAGYRITHAAMAGDLDRFTEGWGAADADLKAGEAAWSAASFAKTPAAVRGLAEMEYGQVRHLYQASRDYAVADSPASGTHYVGQALAALEFARALQGLRFDEAPGAFTVRSYATEIAALDARVVAAYRPPRSIDNHSEFIRVDGTLKMAAELDAAGLHYGALVAWLRSERYFGALEEGWTPDGIPTADALRSTATAPAGRSKKRSDDSIERLLQQQADGAIERSGDPQTGVLQRAMADAILTRALPAWSAARTSRPAAAVAAKDQVRVTLVRWPYT